MTIGARGRKTLREVLAQNNAAERFYAALAGKPLPPKPEPPRPPRQRAAPGADGMPLEKDILKAIMGLLILHPKVAFAGRFNSGTMEEGGRFIQMTSLRGFPDIHFCMKDGRAGYFEVKRPGGRKSDDQIAFIERAQKAGAIAAFVHSTDEAIQILESAT